MSASSVQLVDRAMHRHKLDLYITMNYMHLYVYTLNYTHHWKGCHQCTGAVIDTFYQ